jgi:polyisoprenoid-binding protein YceI
MKPTLSAFVLILAGTFLLSAQNRYDIDSTHSSAQFTVRHMMVSNVRGEFNKVTGVVFYDSKNPDASKIEASIDTATVNTRDDKRDEHLKSADFLDVTKYPSMAFHSKQFTQSGGKAHVRGDLTIRGVTKEVVLDLDGPSPEIKDPYGFLRTGVTATTKINRKDFGLVWNAAIESGGVVVGDEVGITLDIEVVRK